MTIPSIEQVWRGGGRRKNHPGAQGWRGVCAWCGIFRWRKRKNKKKSDGRRRHRRGRLVEAPGLRAGERREKEGKKGRKICRSRADDASLIVYGIAGLTGKGEREGEKRKRVDRRPRSPVINYSAW